MKFPERLLAILLAGLLLPVWPASDRQPVPVQITNDRKLVEYRHNLVIHPEVIHPFLEKLANLKSFSTGTVSILHIGDSHVQADYMTGALRASFQRDFGNAGRGLVVPGRIARSNESATIESKSGGVWEFRKLIYSEQPLPAGIGGYTFNTTDSSAWLGVRMTDGTSFHKRISLFFRKDPDSFLITLRDSADRVLGAAGSYSDEQSDYSRLVLTRPVGEFRLRVWKTLPEQKKFTLFGIGLENGNPGVLYHATGVNGAKFRHYAAEPGFAKQAALLNPDLIILSLGSNEATEYPFKDPKFEQHVSVTIQHLRKFMPDVPILVTTPPGGFLNKTKKNPALENIRDRILGQAARDGLAAMDLWEAGGGNQFATRWRKESLIQEDGIHFTREGYQLQGEMIYLALIEAYNTYVTH